MRRTVLAMLGAWLLSAAVAQAQGLPEGTYASTQEGCTKLAAKTMTELGDDFDFYVLTSKGLTGYEQACDFVNVSARNATSWVATAFCDEASYTYPDLFAIAQKEEGKLAVTRLTDLTQQHSYEPPPDSESPEATDQGETSDDAGAAQEPSTEEGAAAADQTAAADQVSTYVRCQNVKQ
jgi:hypothetical protein